MFLVRLFPLPPLLATTVVVALCTSLVAQEWRTAVGRPEIIVLGSGSHLSVLVRAGQTRLLIAAGDDTDAFDRAYGHVQRPTAPRLDLLVIAGTGRQLVVPERLVDRGIARQVLALRPPGADVQAGVLAESEVAVVRQRSDIRLHDGVTVSLDPLPDYREPESWTVTVSRHATRVLIIPNNDAVPVLAGHGPVSSLIVLGRTDFQSLQTLETGSITVRGDDAEAGLQATADDPAATSGPWVWAVHDSEALRLSFGEGHLRIPSDGARRLINTKTAGGEDLVSSAAQVRGSPPSRGPSAASFSVPALRSALGEGAARRSHSSTTRMPSAGSNDGDVVSFSAP